MYTIREDGVYLEHTESKLLIPYREVIGIRRVNLLQSFWEGFKLLKPGLSTLFYNPTGDMNRLVIIETKTGRYLLRGGDLDELVRQVKARASILT